MLHTKFGGHQFWKRRFLKGFYHIWAWLPYWSCDPDSANKFWFPLSIEASQNLALIGQAIWEKKRFEIVDDVQTDGRRMLEHGYTISSSMSLWLGLGDLTKGSPKNCDSLSWIKVKVIVGAERP